VVINAGAGATATADANPPPTAVNTAFAGTGVRGMPATAQKGSQPNTTSFPPQSTQPPPSTRAGLPKRPPASYFNVRWLHPPHATVHSAHVANVWFAWHSMHKFIADGTGLHHHVPRTQGDRVVVLTSNRFFSVVAKASLAGAAAADEGAAAPPALNVGTGAVATASISTPSSRVDQLGGRHGGATTAGRETSAQGRWRAVTRQQLVCVNKPFMWWMMCQRPMRRTAHVGLVGVALSCLQWRSVVRTQRHAIV